MASAMDAAKRSLVTGCAVSGARKGGCEVFGRAAAPPARCWASRGGVGSLLPVRTTRCLMLWGSKGGGGAAAAKTLKRRKQR